MKFNLSSQRSVRKNKISFKSPNMVAFRFWALKHHTITAFAGTPAPFFVIFFFTLVLEWGGGGGGGGGEGPTGLVGLACRPSTPVGPAPNSPPPPPPQPRERARSYRFNFINVLVKKYQYSYLAESA